MLERLSGAPYLPHRQSLRQDLIALPKSLVSDFALSPLNRCFKSDIATKGTIAVTSPYLFQSASNVSEDRHAD
jgi:hypothetical protein